jgi:hypothetical protein
MVQVHHVKAKKDYLDYGIKKGEMYYWWQHRFHPKRYSKTLPTRSMTTTSDFLGQLYELEDGMPDRFKYDENMTADDLSSELDSFKDEIQNLLDETNEKLENMPDGLRENSSSGEMLQERIDGLENWISELDGIDPSGIDEDNENEDPDYDREAAFQEVIDEILGSSSGL